jgi:hypothetical protein
LPKPTTAYPSAKLDKKFRDRCKRLEKLLDELNLPFEIECIKNVPNACAEIVVNGLPAIRISHHAMERFLKRSIKHNDLLSHDVTQIPKYCELFTEQWLSCTKKFTKRKKIYRFKLKDEIESLVFLCKLITESKEVFYRSPATTIRKRIENNCQDIRYRIHAGWLFVFAKEGNHLVLTSTYFYNESLDNDFQEVEIETNNSHELAQ